MDIPNALPSVCGDHYVSAEMRQETADDNRCIGVVFEMYKR